MKASRSNHAMRDVLVFLFRHWRREAWLVAGVAGAMLMAPVADLFMPVFAGRLVDAVAGHAAHATSHAYETKLQALHAAVWALGSMAALGAVLVAGRYFALVAIIHLTLRLMSRFARDAFWRVQRFSTDWHPDKFSRPPLGRGGRGAWGVGMK